MDKVETTLASILPWRSFGEEGEISLRNDGLLIGYNLQGPSPEMSDMNNLANRVRQFAGGMIHFGTRDAMHIIWHRIPAPVPPRRLCALPAAQMVNDEQREQNAAANWLTIGRAYLSHYYQSPLKGLVQSFLLARRGPQQTQHDLLREYALRRFRAFEDSVASAVTLKRLSSLDMFRDLIMCVRYQDYPALQPTPAVRLNEVIGHERLIGGTAPWINGYHLRPICFTAYPATTVPQILALLLKHAGEMTVCARYLCLDPYDTRTAIEADRHHWNREMMGTIWGALKKSFAKSVVTTTNQDGESQLADIDHALAASNSGTCFGRVTITAIVRDKDEERADILAHELLRECNSIGIMARIEDNNAIEAIMGSWPGMVEENIRQPLMTGANFADLVLPATHWIGSPWIDSPAYPHHTPTPLITSGRGDLTPFYFPTHTNGVSSQIIIGPSGTGKSALLGALVCSYLGIPEARVAWLDLDYSSFVLAHLLEAEYRDLGSQGTLAINPLSMLKQPNGRRWLMEWFHRLYKRWGIELDSRQTDDLDEALRKAKNDGVESFSYLMGYLHGDQRAIKFILRNYVAGGYWGHVFDTDAGGSSGGSTVGSSPVVVYEMRGLLSLGKRAAAPATELILQSIVNGLDGTHPTWIVVDEAWNLLSDETSAEWLFDAIRTFRKKNAGIILATQSLVEVANSPMRDLLLESCPGRIFLPNHEANNSYGREQYRKLGVNDHEISIIARSRPRSEYYYKNSLGSRLFSLHLGPLGQSICAATGYQDVQLARTILERYPVEEFRNAWLGSRQPGVSVIDPPKAVTRGGMAAIAGE